MEELDVTVLLGGWQGILQRMANFSPLVLYGAKHIPQILPFLHQHNVFPKYVLDMEDRGGSTCGMDHVGPQLLESMPTSTGVGVCCLGGIELAQALKRFSDFPVLDAFLPLGHTMFAPHFDPRDIAKNIDRIKSVRSLFADAPSRSLFDRLIAFRLTCDLRLLPMPDTPLYYFSATTPRPGDLIIDGGAYTGDCARSFVAFTGNRSKVYSFEPDMANFMALRHSVQKAGMADRIEPVPMALWREETFVSLSGQGSSACVHDNAEQQVRATTLDLFCSKRRITPTFIKMDLEGAEQEALHGGQNTIASCRPRLALSVYHRPEDLWEIPLLVSRIRPDSRFSLVRHSGPEALAEVVLYVYD